MTTTLTIQSLIQHFENRLRKIDKDLGSAAGREPQFPQLVIYLGGDARNAHPAVSANLLQVWPQYQKELKFLWVKPGGEELSYAELTGDGGQAVELSEDGVQEIASSLFGTKMQFSDRSKLLVYYVLDTTGFKDSEDFLYWLPRIQEVKKLLCANSTDIMDVLVLLLNENLTRQKTAVQLRNHLSGFYQDNDIRKTVRSVLLLSNRRNDNAILESWDICYQILSAAIVLSNNADAMITTDFFNGSVMTASYAREEKPLEQIGQVVVKGLIDKLSASVPPMEARPLEDPRLPEKLGLTKQRTFALLDRYAENNLYTLLPSEEQLELFPRRDDSDRTAMSELTAREFNDYTMGAWEQYLGQISRSAQEKVAMDSTVRADWQKEYRALLASALRRDEMIYLESHLRDVEELMMDTRLPVQDAPVLTAARDQLKYMLSSDRQLRQIFLSALEEQGKVSREFAEAWNSLVKSMRTVRSLRDGSIAAYYELRVQHEFYDKHETEIFSEFARMHETDELDKFLRGTLERIVDNDKIFSCAFEDELENRLNADVLPVDAKQYIRKKLTGDDVFVYLQTNFALGEPLISAILVKAGTALYNSLYNNLAPTTYYYDTGSSNMAEALVIYEVSAENLVNGEDV